MICPRVTDLHFTIGFELEVTCKKMVLFDAFYSLKEISSKLILILDQCPTIESADSI